MECPKCRTEYEQGETECEKCGIIFEKYYQRQLKQEQPPPIAASNNLTSKCKACGNEISLQAASCPNCGDPHSMPVGVKGWSWGACLLNWIWAIGNNTWIGLITLIPGVGFIMAIVLGFKGREWAWKNKQWESVAHFNKIQKRWSVVGVCLLLVPFGAGMFFAIVSPQHEEYERRKAQVEDTSQGNNDQGQTQTPVFAPQQERKTHSLPYQNSWADERNGALSRCSKTFADYQLQAVCLQNEKDGYDKMQGDFGFSELEAQKAKARCSKIFADFQMQAVCMENEKDGYGKIHGN